MTTQAVLLILNSTRAADIPNAIKGLDHEQQAHLMAYLYKVGGVCSSIRWLADTERRILRRESGK